MKLFLTMQFVALVALSSAAEKRDVSHTLTRDGIKVSLLEGNNYTVQVDGIPFSHTASLNVVDPRWTERYYSYLDDTALPENKVEQSDTRIVSRLVSKRSDLIESTQTLELLPGRKLRVSVDVRKTSSTPAIIENRLASISDNWLSNVTWQATLTDGETTAGLTPKWAPSATPAESMIVSQFSRATFRTFAGNLDISTSGSAPMSMVDYRRSPFADGVNYYWFGVLGTPIPDNKNLVYETIIQFPETPSPTTRTLKADNAATVKSGTIVRKPAPLTDRIIPTPKVLTWGAGHTKVSTELSLSGMPLSAPPLQALVHRWKQHLGVNLVAVPDGGTIAVTPTTFRLPDWQNDEAYRLRVTDNTIHLDCHTTTGLLNGLRTLEQLITPADSGKVTVRQAEIYDYPALPFRGIHFFSGKDSRDLQIKMLSEIMAPLKINQLVYQVDYVKWETQPQIHHDRYGMDKADAIAVGNQAQALGINVIPMVNTFGHSEWLLGKQSMRYLADDPDNPYAYDPSNPEVYRICEGIYKEAIAMFNPTVMHIGHDEIHLDGFPRKPENQAVGATELVARDIRHYHAFLKKLGIRTMMWGDMFLGPDEAPDAALAPTIEEAKRRRAMLPEDIIITDWHYKAAPVEDYKSMAIFNKAGFETIACPWYSPDNIVRLAKAANLQRQQDDRTKGLLQTTWAGYSFDEHSLRNNLEQYAAYVLAAEAAWTGGTTESASVPFDFVDQFLRRWNDHQNTATPQTGWQLSLDKLSNIALKDAHLSIADTALDGLPPGENHLNGTAYLLPGHHGNLAGIAMTGAWSHPANSPGKIELPVNQATREISFAIVAPFAMHDTTPVGTLTLHMEDGTSHVVKLAYGVNILGIADGRRTFGTSQLWKSANARVNEGAAILHELNWANPSPGTRVKQITLESAPTGPGIILMGVTGN